MKDKKAATKPTVYVVGRYSEKKNWEFCGVYTDEKTAVEKCTTELHFVRPVEFDRDVSHSTIGAKEDWPGAYYPKYDYM